MVKFGQMTWFWHHNDRPRILQKTVLGKKCCILWQVEAFIFENTNSCKYQFIPKSNLKIRIIHQNKNKNRETIGFISSCNYKTTQKCTVLISLEKKMKVVPKINKLKGSSVAAVWRIGEPHWIWEFISKQIITNMENEKTALSVNLNEFIWQA